MAIANAETKTAKDFATEAFESALQAQNRSETSVQQSTDLITQLEQFLTLEKATSQQVQEKAQEVNLLFTIQFIFCVLIIYLSSVESLKDLCKHSSSCFN